MLVPYFGPRPDHVPGGNLRWYGNDCPANYAEYLRGLRDGGKNSSGGDAEWNYSLNSLGFRGEEFDPHADFRVYVVGCSHTFGTGVRLEDTWASRLTEALAGRLHKARRNCLNFAQGGANNDYIFRTAYDQISRVGPDLLVIQFTFLGRMEYVSKEQVRGFIPHNADKSPEFLALLEWYTDEMAVISLLKSMLLLQYVCQSKSIPYIFFFVPQSLEGIEECRTNPIVARLYDRVDTTRIMRGYYPALDRARDNRHFGPRSQHALAQALAEFYLSLY